MKKKNQQSHPSKVDTLNHTVLQHRAVLKLQWAGGISANVIQILLYNLNPYKSFSKCAQVRVYR